MRIFVVIRVAGRILRLLGAAFLVPVALFGAIPLSGRS